MGNLFRWGSETGFRHLNRNSAQGIILKSKGFAIEQRVEDYLVSHGLKLIKRNYSCRRGEIDLIMLENDAVVFVEVRFRKSTSHGTPEETITKAKIRKLVFAARLFLQTHPMHDTECRFDVVGVTQSQSGELIFNWIKDAFGE
ncbi:MAG: YraN family protein [Hahellaceae bacterium]|nr:YraN family protein [Hahellaceae bacterium]MCP5210791.1 YraN family protein [Hahellaceae bacterium]